MVALIDGLRSRWGWGYTSLIVVAGVVAIPSLGSVAEIDVLWHVLMGHSIVTGGGLSGDPAWQYGPHQDWITTQAGSEVMLYLLWKVFGWAGLTGFRVLSGIVMFSTAAWVAMRIQPRGATPNTRALVASLTAGLATVLTPVNERPQMISFILLPIVGLYLYRALYTGQYPKWWKIAILTSVWTCFHGASLIVGPLFGFIWVMRLLLPRLHVNVKSIGEQGPFTGLWVALAAIGATLVTPIGIGVYRQAIAISHSAGPYIREWARTSLDDAIPLIFITVLWVLAIVMLKLRWLPRRALVLDLVMVLPMLVYGATSMRSVPVAALLLLPLLARRLGQVAARYLHLRPHRLAYIIAVTVVAVAVPTMIWVNSQSESAARGYAPFKILNGFAATTGERRVIEPYNLAGPFMFQTQPGVRVAIDGRSDRYSPDTIGRYLALHKGEKNWREYMAQYPQTTDVVMRSDSPVISALKSDGWNQACSDIGYVWLTAPGISGRCGEDNAPKAWLG